MNGRMIVAEISRPEDVERVLTEAFARAGYKVCDCKACAKQDCTVRKEAYQAQVVETPTAPSAPIDRVKDFGEFLKIVEAEREAHMVDAMDHIIHGSATKAIKALHRAVWADGAASAIKSIIHGEEQVGKGAP